MACTPRRQGDGQHRGQALGDGGHRQTDDRHEHFGEGMVQCQVTEAQKKCRDHQG
jgi:hypothetical protein